MPLVLIQLNELCLGRTAEIGEDILLNGAVREVERHESLG